MKHLNSSFATRVAITLILLIITATNLSAQVDGDYQTATTGARNWSNTATWQKRVAGAWVASPDYPGQNSGAGTVTILNNTQVTLDVSPANAIGSLAFAASTTLATNLTITGRTLNVTGAITFGTPTADAGDQTLIIGSGILSCASLSMPVTGNDVYDDLVTISTGTLTVSGNIIMNDTNNRNNITFSGSGILNVGGNFTGGGFTASTGTINYNGVAAQNVGAYTYNNLTLNGSGAYTLQGTSTVSATLAFTSGALMLNGNTLNLNGATTIGTGTITGSSTSNISIASSNNAGMILPAISGGLQNLSINKTGTTATVTLSSAVALSGNLTLTNGTLLANGWTIDLTGDLTSTGSLTYTTGTLNIAGNFSNTGTFTCGTGIVNYTGTGNQTIRAINYYNLMFSGARTLNSITLANSGTIGIANSFTNSATFTSGGIINTGSTINYNGTGAQTIRAFSYNNLTISGAHTTNNITFENSGEIGVAATLTYSATFTTGTLITSGSTVNYNSTGAQTITALNYYNLTLSGSRTSNSVTLASAGIIGIANTFDPSTTFTSGGYINTTSTIDYNGTGSQTIKAFNYNNLTASGARTTNNVTFEGTGEVGVAATLSLSATFTSGAFITTGSTINFNGNVAQTIPATTASFSYYNLKASLLSTATAIRTKTLGATTLVSNNLTIESANASFVCSLDASASNLTVTGTTTLNAWGAIIDGNNTGANIFNGKVTINANGTFNPTSTSTISFGGGITNNGTFTKAGNGTTTFITNSQTIDGANALSFTGGDFIISDPVALSLSNSLNLSGTNFTNNSNAVVAFNQTAGTTTLVPNAAQTINNGTGTGSVTFYNLTLSGGNIKTANRVFAVTNQLTANSATFSLGALATTFTVGGDVALNGTGLFSAGTGASTINFNGNITIDGTLDFGTATAKTVNIAGDIIDVTGTIIMNGAALAHTLNLNGANNAISTLTTTAASGSTVNYNRSGNQQIFSSANYQNLNVSNSGVKTIQTTTSVAGNVNVQGTSTLDLNGTTLTLAGNATINSGSTLEVDANAQLLFSAAAKTITNNGTFKVVGTAGNPAIVSRTGAGTYNIVQTLAGSEFQANYYQFNYLTGGITISNGTINSTNNFSNGSFSNGAGAQYINTTGLTTTGLPNIVNTVFNSGPTYNVTRTSGTGEMNFEDATGTLAGENYDSDNGNPGTLVNWVYPSTVYYSTGNVSAGLLTSWTKNADGTGGNPSSITDGLKTLIIQDGHTVTLDNNGDLNVLNLQVGQGTSGALIIGNDATTHTLRVNELLDVRTGASLTAGSAGTTPHKLLIYGNFVNNGITNLKGGSNLVNTEFYGNNMIISGSQTPIFSDVTFKTGSNTTTSVDLDVNQSVNIEAGATFNDGGKTINVYKDWVVTNTSTYTASGTVVFDGPVNTITDNNNPAISAPFNNVTFDGAGASIIYENATFNGNVNITNGKGVTISSSATITITANKNFAIDSNSSYSQTTSGTTIFAGTSSQTIDLQGSNTFYNLTFSNGGTNSKTIQGDLSVAGLTTISAGATIDGTGSHSLTAGLTVNGTCNLSGIITMKGGSLTSTNTSLTLGTAELRVDGNVGITTASTLTANVNNNVTVLTGTLTLNNNTQLVGVTGKTFKVETSRTLNVRGNNNFPTGFSNYDLASSSVTNYDANIDQTVRGNITYGVLNFAGTGFRKTVDGPLDINGSMTINGSILDLQSYSHTFAGAALNNSNNASIAGGSSTFTFDADDAVVAIQATGTGSYTFNNLYISQNNATTTRTKTFASGCNMTINNDFKILNGSGSSAILLSVVLNDNAIGGTPRNWDVGEYCQVSTLSPDFYTAVTSKFTGTKTLDINSTICYTGNVNQIIADGLIYGKLLLDGNGNKTARGPLDINGSVSRLNGTPVFYDGGFTHTVAGDWNLNNTAYYTQASATGTIVFDGNNQDISGVNFNNLEITNTGIVSQLNDLTIYGNLKVNAGANLNVSTRALSIAGNITVLGSGLLNQTTGVTTMNGAAIQTIQSNANSTLGALIVNKPNAAGLQKVTILSELHILGTTTLTANAGLLDISNQEVYFGGFLNINDNTIETGSPFITAGSTAYFNGTTSQYIRNYNTNTLAFNNITFSGSGDKLLQYVNAGATRIDVNGNFTINSSTVDGWNEDIYVRGNWDNSGTFQHTGNRSVYFDGADQTISSSSFRYVNIQGTGTKTLLGNITLSNNLTLAAATLNANGYNITIGGSWDNSAAGASFTPGTGKVVFNGGGSNITTGTTTGRLAGKAFNDVEINLTGNANMLGDMELNNLTITSGSLNTSSYDMWVSGDFVNNATFNHNNNSSAVTLNATGGTKRFKTNGTTFRELDIDATGAQYVAEDNFAVSVIDMKISAGELLLNKNKLSVNTNAQKIVISGSGVLNVDSASTVEFKGTTQAINLTGGALKIVGNEGKSAKLTGNPSAFTVTQSGGTIYANHYQINNGKITITAGTIDASDNFSNGEFSGGTGYYLTLTGLNFTDFSVDNVTFNPAAAGTKNVIRTSGSGAITFQNPSGAWAGQFYESDNGVPGTLINWTFPAGYFWDNESGDNNWHNSLNWLGNTVPDKDAYVILNHTYVAGAYTVNINTSDALTDRFIMDAPAGPAINVAVANGYSLTAKNNIQIGVNTTLSQADATSLIYVGKGWSNLGTYTHGNSSVIFNGPQGDYTIYSGGVAAGKRFYNLTINGTSANYSLSSPLQVENNLTITKGQLLASTATNTISVGGNWLLDADSGGLFDPSTSSVTLNGTNQSITNGTFYNLIFSGSGTKSITTNIKASNDFTIGSGITVNGDQNILYVSRNWVNNGGSLSQTGLGTVSFDGTAAQSIDFGTASTTFNHLEFKNAGIKTFYKDVNANGNVTINTGSGTVNLNTYKLTGLGSTNTFTNFATLQLQGASNFPVGFETVDLNAVSTVNYRADINQDVYVTTYGNISLGHLTAGHPTSKKALGNLIILGNVNLNVDGETTLDMATNDANITLTGTINVTAGSSISWGTGNSTLTHVGADWYISANITSFNHLILAGTGDKYTQGNLTTTGNVTVKTGIDLFMYSTGGSANYRTLSNDGTGVLTLESGARILNSRPASDGPGIPTGFLSYQFDPASTYFMYSPIGVNQQLYTGTSIQYGNLYFRNAKTVTSDGISDLKVMGDFDIEWSTYVDNGKNIDVKGANIYLTGYTPSASTITLTLDGPNNQYIRDGIDNTIPLGNLVLGGTGTKTLGDGNDSFTIDGNLTNQTGVTATSARNIAFNGSSWTNNGIFTHTANTITFGGASSQSINAGASNAANHFNNVAFSNASTKTFINNGADINGTLTINAGTVDMGALSHHIYGSVTNTSGGILTSNLADITFDGGNQNINTPAFATHHVVMTGGGTKRMFSDWTIGGDLTINAGTILNTSDAVIPTYYNINIAGNWINNGTFTANTSKVTFNGSIPSVNIQAGTSNFYDVDIAAGSVVYSLQSTSTRFSHTMNLGAGAELNLNSKTLILGSNTASGKTYSIAGTLTVNQNAFLKFNNQTSQSIMNVTGKLNIVGANQTALATITREIAGVAGNETQINIQSGGTIAARYYLIEYLQDAGMNLQTGSTLDATNNFSDGTWSNIRTVANVRYLTLESNYSGGTISNITFNYSGTPVQGTHFNVIRKLAATPVTFDVVGGNLGSYKFESDEEATPSATTGLLRWPALTVTNWLGTISSDWHVAGNWDNGVPTLTLDAIIPDRANDPIISNGDAVCKKLSITNGTLIIDNNRNLTSASDLEIGTGTSTGILSVNTASSTITDGGSWTCGTGGIFVNGGGGVVFNSGTGSATITPRANHFKNVSFNNASTTFYLVGTAIYFDGNVAITNGTVTPNTASYNFHIKGDYAATGGTFTPIAALNGSITLDGATDQAINNGTFYHLFVSGSGNKTFNGTTVIDGKTTINSSMTAGAGANIDFNGDFESKTGSTFNDGDGTHTFAGVNWTGSGSYAGNGTIIFDRANSDQNLYASTLHNLDVNCQGTSIFYLRGDVALTNNFTIRNGINYANMLTYTVTNTSGTGVFTLEDGERMDVSGNNNFPKGFGTYTLGASSTVNYAGASDQNVDGVSYGNLTLANANTKTLIGNTAVKGILTFGTATLDVSTNNYSLTVGGNWNNNSTGNFICHNGDVILNGEANQNITISGTSTNTFYNLKISKSVGSAVANNNTANPFTVLNNLTVDGGQFDANNRTIYVGGDLIASTTGTFTNNSGTYYLNKTSGSASIGANGSSFRNITINSSGNATYTALDNIALTGIFDLTSGTFDGNGKDHSIGDSDTDIANIAGTYKIGAGGNLGLGYGTTLTVTTTGRIEAVGTSSALATISNNASGGRYNFIVNGTIAAKYYLFEYMSNGGIYLSNTSTVDATNNFSEGTFTNGTTTGPMLRIENTQSFVAPNYIANVTFPVDPTGAGTNVAKTTAASGTLEFYNATGAFSGAAFENDPYNIINWTGPVKLTWNGSISSNWNNSKNWTASYGPAIVPTGAEDVIIASAVNQPILTTFGQKTKNLTINSGASITMNTPSDAGAIDLDVNGDILLNGNLNSVSTNDFITVEGNWTKAATSTVSLQGNVTFDGTTGARVINNRGIAFNSLTISGTSQYQLGFNTIANSSLTINANAILDVTASNYSLTVKGNWVNNGTFNARTGKVTFSATSGSPTIYAGASSFNDMDINSSGITYQLTGAGTIKHALFIASGTLTLNGQTLNIGDGIGADNISISGTLLANANSTLVMGNNSTINVNSSGTIQLLGFDNSNRANVKANGNNRYAFNVNAGANISAKYYAISNTDASGLNIKSGAILNSTNNLSDGLFSNGNPGSGCYITLNNEMSAEEEINRVIFNAGTVYNVSRTSGTTIFNFIDASGALSGYLYENDMSVPDATSGLIRWGSNLLYSWVGNTSDWFTASNWYNSVMPDATSDVTIPSGRPFNPIIGTSATAEVNGITIKSGASLTLAAGGKLTVNGNITNNGTLTLVHTSAAPSSFINYGTITGNATIQQTLASTRNWYIGHAMNTNTSAYYGSSPAPTDMQMGPYLTASSKWSSKLATGVALSTPMQGYLVYFGPSGGPFTVTHTGTLYSGNQSFALTYGGDYWNLLSNPYPTYVDLKSSATTWDLSHVDPTVWVRSKETGVYKFLTFNTAVNVGSTGFENGILAPMQAFWVKATSAGSVMVKTTARTHPASTQTLKAAESDPNDVLRLQVSNASAADEAIVVFRSIGNDALSNIDSEKRLESPGVLPQLFSVKGNKNVAINVMPEDPTPYSVPLALTVGAKGAGEMTIKASNITEFLPAVNVYLKDLSTGTITDLRQSPSYTFTSDAVSAQNRFELFFQKVPNTATGTDVNEASEAATIMAYSIGQKGIVNINDTNFSGHAIIEVFDSLGQLITNKVSDDKRTEIDLTGNTQMVIIKVTYNNLVKSFRILKTMK
jgi:hypothetical protein